MRVHIWSNSIIKPVVLGSLEGPKDIVTLETCCRANNMATVISGWSKLMYYHFRKGGRPTGSHHNNHINCCRPVSIPRVMGDRCWHTPPLGLIWDHKHTHLELCSCHWPLGRRTKQTISLSLTLALPWSQPSNLQSVLFSPDSIGSRVCVCVSVCLSVCLKF